MRFSFLFIFCLLSVQNINSTVMLNCALGLVEEKQCPVDGAWSMWTTWSNCEGQCSSVGQQIRTRNCSNPPPSNNGDDCVGNQFEMKGCGVPGCSYEQYEKLFAQDHNRLQQLKVLKQASGSQNALLTKCLLSDCSFETISQTLGNSGTQFWNPLQCVKKNTGCPVAGGWGEWTEWSRCSALCGQGEQFRCHACCDPPPSSTHTSCHGESCEFQSCAGTRCGQSQKEEGTWSSWSKWSVCSAPCRLGLSRRSRTCLKGNQKKAKKSLVEEANSVDDVYYYDDYFDDRYGQDVENDLYRQKGFVQIDQLPIVKKRAGEQCDTKIEYYSTEDDEEYSTTTAPKSLIRTSTMQVYPLTTNNLQNVQNLPNICDAKIEYYSTEDDEEYSTTVSKSLIRTSITQVHPLTTNNLQNVQNLPKTKQLQLKHLDSTTSLDHLLQVQSTSTKLTTKHSYPNTVEAKTTTSLLETSKINLKEHYHRGFSEPMRVSSTTKLVETFKSTLKEHSHKVCSEPMSVSSTKPSKPPNNLAKPHTQGKGKSAKNHLRCKSTTLLTESTNIQTNTPVQTCNYDTNSAEENYQIESKIVPDTTVFEEKKCTDKLKQGIEEEISMFGNIQVNEPYAKGKKKSDEGSTDRTESRCHERDSDKYKTTCMTIKPEDDILNLGKELDSTIQPKTSHLQTLKYSIANITESFKSTYSSLKPHNERKTDQSNDDWPSTTSSPTSVLMNDLVSSTNREKTTEDLDFDNTSDILSQHGCDIRKILQLPSYNNSFVADDCKGPFEEIKSCNTKPCSKEGGWSSWSTWSPCSKECGLGKQVSTRSCTQPEPVENGQPCKGETARKRSCYEQICPVKVASPRAMMMSGDSYIEYDMLHQHSSVLFMYLRFQPFNCSGSLIIRKPLTHCENHRKCDLTHISLYNCHIFLVVRIKKCFTYLLSSVRLSVGDWHEILITVVGAAVTMRLDDSTLTQSANLSCRPSAPNFDSKMKVGGHIVVEIDRLRINFKNYHLQKKHTKRDILYESEENVEPEEMSQVQFLLNKEETTTLSLATFIHAPCFVNESSWRIEVALKPEFSEGLLLFFRGYNRAEFVLVTLEHNRLRLQVKVSSESAECERPIDISPHTWIHVAVSKPSAGPVGLAVNGGERCVVSFVGSNSAEEPSIRCTAGIFLGEVPKSVRVVNNEGEPDYLNSPLGLLGSLTVDNHTLDLSRLPHKTTSDVSFAKHYKFSSDMVSATVHYEEMFILEGEPFSLMCLYDLSSGQTRNSSNISGRSLDLSEYSASWIKLDLPVETAFETSASNITYHIADSGKSTSLNVSHYADFKSIEGFYSCWLQYPLPLKAGLNIITYSVVTITDRQDESWWIKTNTVFNITIIIVLLLVCVIEAILNFKGRSGFYRCKKMGDKDTRKRVKSIMFSKEGEKLLGSTEAAHESYQRYFSQTDGDISETEFNKAQDQNDSEPLFSDPSDDDLSVDDVKIIIPDKTNAKEIGKKKTVNAIVQYLSEERHLNPFFTKDKNESMTEKASNLRVIKGKVFNPSTVSIDDLQTVEDVDMQSVSGDGKEMTVLRNYSIKNSAELKKKEVGLIQKTSAYKSIENELKFKPEKLKFFYKHSDKNKGNK